MSPSTLSGNCASDQIWTPWTSVACIYSKYDLNYICWSLHLDVSRIINIPRHHCTFISTQWADGSSIPYSLSLLSGLFRSCLPHPLAMWPLGQRTSNRQWAQGHSQPEIDQMIKKMLSVSQSRWEITWKWMAHHQELSRPGTRGP